MLALPADPGARGQRLFHQRGGVDEHLDVRPLRLRRGDKKRSELFELSFDDIVIVAMARVDGNRASILDSERRKRIAAGAVVEAKHDEAPRAGHQRSWIGPPLKAFLHPPHVAMRAVGEPCGEALASALRRLGGRDPAGVEAERSGPGAERR